MTKQVNILCKTAILSASVFMLSACGGAAVEDDSGLSPGQDPVSEVPVAEQPLTEEPDNEQPGSDKQPSSNDIHAEIVFPTLQADVGEGIDGDLITVSVRVTSEQGAASVSANGVNFERDAHDSNYWYGRVPVATGETELVVTLEDEAGETTLLTQTLNNNRIEQITPLSVRQTADGRVYFLDQDRRLYQAHDDGGVEAVGGASCWGHVFTLNAEQTKAYVLGARLCEVDLSTNEAQVLFDLASSDDAPPFFSIFGMAVSADDRTVFVSLSYEEFNPEGIYNTFSPFRILKIDTETKEVAEVALQDPPLVYLLAETPKLGVADAETLYLYMSLIEQKESGETISNENTLFAVSLTSGEMRAIAAVDNLPREPDALRLNAAGDVEFLDINNAALAVVDVVDGNYQLLNESSVSPIPEVDRSVGSGPVVAAKGFALADDGDYLYITTDDGLYRVELATGTRTRVGDLSCAHPCEIELDGNTAYVLEQVPGEGLALMAMNVLTGSKTLVSGDSMGSGGVLLGGEGMALDKANNRMFIATGWPFRGDAAEESVDAGPLMEVDLETGNRRNAWYQWFDDPASAAARCESYAYGAMDAWINDDTGQLFIWGAHLDDLSVADVRDTEISCRATVSAVAVGRSASPGYSSFFFDRVRQTAYFSNREYQALASLDFSRHYDYLMDPQLTASEEMPFYVPSPSADRQAPLFDRQASGVELAQTLNHFSHDNTNVVIDEKNAIAYMNSAEGGIVALFLLTGDRVVISH